MGNCDVKIQIAEDERMAEQFSSEKVLDLLFMMVSLCLMVVESAVKFLLT